MSATAVIERPRTDRVQGRDPRGQSLGQLLARTLSSVREHRDAVCPVCHGRMAPRYGAAGVEPLGGRCADCGATLS
jgi:tRNA(Ile2) C34 agmatinyltransferase TiaS